MAMSRTSSTIAESNASLILSFDGMTFGSFLVDMDVLVEMSITKPFNRFFSYLLSPFQASHGRKLGAVSRFQLPPTNMFMQNKFF